MKKIKIIHVIQALIYGGAETCLLDICRNINTYKFEIVIITFWEGDSLEKEFNKLSNIKLVNLNCSSRYDIKIIHRLLKALKHEIPDIIHTHLPIAGIYSRICNKFISAKFITTQHSVKYVGNIFHKIDRFTAKWNHYFIANSEYTKQFLIKFNYANKDNINVIPLGIDFSKFDNKLNKQTEIYKELNIPEDAIIIGHIGSFKIQKGHRYIIEVAKKIISHRSNVYFLLIGDGKLFDNIQKLAQKLGVYKYIRFAGVKNNIADYLNIMDIFIMPSISESFGISILEAMYMKIPIVAFATDAIPELISHKKTGLLSNKYDIKKMNDVLLELLNNPKMKEQLCNNAYENVIKKYSIIETTKKLEDFYLSILK